MGRWHILAPPLTLGTQAIPSSQWLAIPPSKMGKRALLLVECLGRKGMTMTRIGALVSGVIRSPAGEVPCVFGCFTPAALCARRSWKIRSGAREILRAATPLRCHGTGLHALALHGDDHGVGGPSPCGDVFRRDLNGCGLHRLCGLCGYYLRGLGGCGRLRDGAC